jgi:hypothetical protein
VRRGDDGYVTAETAVVVPSLVLLVGMMLWGLMSAAALVECVDAARAGARAAARGEPEEAVLRTVRSAAPPGARTRMTREKDLVRVTVTARSAGPGPLSLPLRGGAVALAEDSLGPAPAGAGAEAGTEADG